MAWEAELPAGEPASARYAARSWQNPLCFGASSDPSGPPASPAEQKAAPLLSPKGYHGLEENRVQNAEGMMLSVHKPA